MIKTMKAQKQKAPGQAGGKKRLLAGLVLILLAFVGTVAMLYVLIGDLNGRTQRLEELRTEMDLLAEERQSMADKNDELAARVGTGISLDRLLSAAEEVYPDDVKNSRTGYLWVDRQADAWMITLGAVNGLRVGTRLPVYDGDQVVDTVEVETPLDVISYVRPTQKLKSQFDKDYFRVVIE